MSNGTSQATVSFSFHAKLVGDGLQTAPGMDLITQTLTLVPRTPTLIGFCGAPEDQGTMQTTPISLDVHYLINTLELYEGNGPVHTGAFTSA